jgi:hypothetical protein
VGQRRLIPEHWSLAAEQACQTNSSHLAVFPNLVPQSDPDAELSGGRLRSFGLIRIPLAGPDRTFAKPVESFFELSIIAAPSFHEGRGNEPK